MANDTPIETGTAAKQRRGWRLGFSTWLVVGLTASVLVLLNWPGEPKAVRMGLGFSFGPHTFFYEHGWPWSFLERPVERDPNTGEYLGLWRLLDKVREFRLLCLAGNLFVALAILAAVAAGWEWRTRRLGRWWRFSLREALLFTAVCAAVMGWWTKRRAYESEAMNTLNACADRGDRLGEPEPALPLWLRHWLGDDRLRCLHINKLPQISVSLPTRDRRSLDPLASAVANYPELISIYVHANYANPADDEQTRQELATRFPAVQHLWLSEDVCTDEMLAVVRQLKQLRLLGINMPFGRPSSIPIAPKRPPENWEWLGDLTELRQLAVSAATLDKAALRSWNRLQNLEEIELEERVQFPEGGLEELLPLPHLQTLSLSGTYAGDVDLSKLGQSNQLERLTVNLRSADDRTLVNVGPLPNLRSLGIDASRLTAKIFPQLQQFPNLQSLYLGNLDVSDADWEKLPPLASLENLRISRSPLSRLDPALFDRFPQLESLWVGECPLTAADAKSWPGRINVTVHKPWPRQKLSTLLATPWYSEYLKLKDLNATIEPADEDLAELPGAEKLTGVSFGDSMVSDTGLRQIVTLPHLTSLDVANSRITADGLDCLPKCVTLEMVDVDQHQLTDASIRALQGLPKLKYLRVRTNVFPRDKAAFQARLQEAFPNSEVVFNNF